MISPRDSRNPSREKVFVTIFILPLIIGEWKIIMVVMVGHGRNMDMRTTDWNATKTHYFIFFALSLNDETEFSFIIYAIMEYKYDNMLNVTKGL